MQSEECLPKFEIDEYQLVFHAYWSDWEEDGWIVICEKGGQYYYQEGGHCVMVENHDENFAPEPISQEEALQLMLEWEEHEDTSATTVSEAFLGETQ